MFRFATPQYLYLLLLIPAVVAVFVLTMRTQKARLEKFGLLATLRKLMPDASPRRVRNKFIIWTVALCLIIVALARPQFGSKLREVKQKGIEIMFAIDVSNSMLASDIEPSRLERTKFAINQLLDAMTGDKIGLVVFAGEAYVQLPITGDYVSARNFINQITPGMISRQGTSIGAAIDLASSSFSHESEGSRVIVLISDGENHDDDPIAPAKKAKKDGIKIYTIGVGTPQGAPVNIDGEFIKDHHGNMVVSKLDEETLERIAILTDGAYIRSNNKSVGLTEIMNQIDKTEKKEFTRSVFEEYNEQYQYLLAAAILLLLLDTLILGRKNKALERFNIFNKDTGSAQR